MEKTYLLCIFIFAVILALIFSGVHTFFCFILGILWPCYLYFEDGPKDHILLGKWKMSYHRYSFIKFVKYVDEKFNEYFNKKRSAKVASLIRISPAALFFIFLNGLLPFRIEWYFTLLGGVIFEWLYVHRKA